MIEKFEVEITPYHLKRMIHLYLPEDYYDTDEYYPVMYMYDGHNLFYDEDATYGKSWGLKDYLDENEKMIIVGIECNHEGTKRLDEFCPYEANSPHFGDIHGTGKVFMKWVVNELKPFIDSNYRTLKDRDHTMIGGSSMGGLMSLYTIVAYNNVFSKAACLSSSIALCFDDIILEIKKHKRFKSSKVFLSLGSDESRNKTGLAYSFANQLEVAHLLLDRGIKVYPYLQVNGAHNEASWEALLPVCMPYLYDFKKTK